MTYAAWAASDVCSLVLSVGFFFAVEFLTTFLALATAFFLAVDGFFFTTALLIAFLGCAWALMAALADFKVLFCSF